MNAWIYNVSGKYTVYCHQQLHQYQKNEKLPLFSNSCTQKTRIYGVGNPGLGLRYVLVHKKYSHNVEHTLTAKCFLKMTDQQKYNI